MAQSLQVTINKELHRILGLDPDCPADNQVGCNALSARTVLVHHIASSLCASLGNYIHDVWYVGSVCEGTSIDVISDHDLMLDLGLHHHGFEAIVSDLYGPAHCEISVPEGFKEIDDLLDENRCISPNKVLKELKLKIEGWQFKASTTFFHQDNVKVSYTRTKGPSVPLTVEFTPAVITAADLANGCFKCLRILLREISKKMPSVVSESAAKQVLDCLKKLKNKSIAARETEFAALGKSDHGLYEIISNLTMGVNCICPAKTAELAKPGPPLAQESPLSFSIDLVPMLSAKLYKHKDNVKPVTKDYVAKPPKMHANWMKIDSKSLSEPPATVVDGERLEIVGKFKAFVNEKRLMKNGIRQLIAWKNCKKNYILIDMGMTDGQIEEVDAPSRATCCELVEKLLPSRDRIQAKKHFSELKKMITKWKESAKMVGCPKKSLCGRAITVTYKDKESGKNAVTISMIPCIIPEDSCTIYVALPSVINCWRESYSRKELDKLTKLNHTSVMNSYLLRIFKIMRYSVVELRPFPNYCFKNILMTLSDKPSWQIEDLTERFLEMVKEFVVALENRKLKQCYNDRVNLLSAPKFTKWRLAQAMKVLTGDYWDGGDKVAKLLQKVDLHKALGKADLRKTPEKAKTSEGVHEVEQ